MRAFLFLFLMLFTMLGHAQTFEYYLPIENSSDDAEQEGSFIDINDLELDLGVSNGEESLIGLFFRSVNLDVQSSVDSAIILLTLQQDFDSALTVNILLEDETKPSSYIDSLELKENRSFYAESISWTINRGIKGDQIASPDLSSLINQILSENDWSSTSGINFIIDPADQATDSNSNELQIYSYDQSQTSRRPQLMMVTDSANINGIDPSSVNSAISIYPNPTNDQFNIEGINGFFEINIFDLNGRLMLHYSGENQNIDLSMLSPGFYTMSIMQNGNTRLEKFAKQTN